MKIVSYTILINGEPSVPFNAAKGHRQRDHMSSFLFVLVMEYLSRSLKELPKKAEFHYHPIWSKLAITHLCFADDILLFARGDLSSVVTMQHCFNQFSAASSLKANLGKSLIYFGGVNRGDKDRIVQEFGLIESELPFNYLGVPLSTKKLSLVQWQPLIEKIVARISAWTAKKLSYGGRVQLVQIVLFGVQAYWAQLFVLPDKVLKTIDAYCRSYVWSSCNIISNKSLVSWERVCAPKSVGSLGLANLQKWNKAAIAKSFWDLTQKQDKLWIKWIHAYYTKGQAIETMTIPQQAY
uniref:Uncharacterized protein LOC104236815 n=1 Tax=Nicotiana sylvestris TaxID=4096 RepID=A0A1U7XQD1_NICSY|nr:PREDICTED: uncharacterized protein LOC104236815 [Nicotiana sylvestris]